MRNSQAYLGIFSSPSSDTTIIRSLLHANPEIIGIGFRLAWFFSSTVHNLSSPNAHVMTQSISSPCPVARAPGNLKCVSLRASTRVSSNAHIPKHVLPLLWLIQQQKCARMLATLVRGSTRVDACAARNTQRTDLQHAGTDLQSHRDEVETSVHPHRIP